MDRGRDDLHQGSRLTATSNLSPPTGRDAVKHRSALQAFTLRAG
ncbi:hypothetical protein ACFFX0_32035 [Citricoccus parietis]|uniref:Uncharacterized protein n=1 Tax=Citricoccus parietis TaxID=592307 RepID=A0ABV5G9B4_9MICC